LPARSPDLNIIEHVWDMLGRTLLKYPIAPTSLEQLEHRLYEQWANISLVSISHLYDSLPRRMIACHNARGGHTRY
jgi:hypothetical protein